MKELNQYISEKLKVNKDVNVYKHLDEENFIKAIDWYGEIYLDLIFDDHPDVEWPWTPSGHSIKAIYVVDGKLIAEYDDNYKHIEGIEEEIKFNDFTKEQQNLIYDYILNTK